MATHSPRLLLLQSGTPSEFAPSIRSAEARGSRRLQHEQNPDYLDENLGGPEGTFHRSELVAVSCMPNRACLCMCLSSCSSLCKIQIIDAV